MNVRAVSSWKKMMRRCGFSLLEAVISLGILSIAVTSICSLITSASAFHNRQAALSELMGNLETSLLVLTSELKRADQVVSPVASGSVSDLTVRRKNPRYDPADAASAPYMFVRYYLRQDADESKVLMRQTWCELVPGTRTDTTAFPVSRTMESFLATYDLDGKTFDLQIKKKSIHEQVEAKAFVNLCSMQ